MNAPRAERASTRCENCETVLQGHYCHICGQHAHNPLRHFGHALEEVFESFWHLDGRIFRTLRDLFVPGRLATAYLDGRRARYIPPLRLFVIMSLLAFFVGKLSLHVSPNTPIDTPAGAAKPSGLTVSISDERIENSAYASATTIEQVAKIRAQKLRKIEEAQQDPFGRWVMSAFGDVTTRLTEEAAERRWKQLGATPEQIRALRARAGTAKTKTHPATKPAAQRWLTRWIVQRLERARQNSALMQKDPDLVVRLFFGALPGALFVLVPFFALFLKLAYLGSGRTYLEHLVVALYSHAFLLAALLGIFMLIGLWGLSDGPGPTRLAIVAGLVTLGVLIPFYLLWMQKRVYGQGWITTSLKYLVLGMVYSVLLSFGILYALFAGLSS